MYKPLSEKHKLEIEQTVLCYCPEWCASGYQVAYWNGKEFEYDGQTNDDFDSKVVSFALLNDDGETVEFLSESADIDYGNLSKSTKEILIASLTSLIKIEQIGLLLADQYQSDDFLSMTYTARINEMKAQIKRIKQS